MKGAWTRLTRDKRGAVAPTVALSLVALIATGGIAFDYARLATLDSELQNAADQAALAGASQLDGQTGAVNRAVAAAQSLLVNQTLLGNDGGGMNVQTGTTTGTGAGTVTRIVFYSSKPDAEAGTNGVNAATATDATARFIKVGVVERKANYALTPIVGAITSGNIAAEAIAGLGSAICKVPPVMICNPTEPANNTNELLDYSPAAGVGLRLITGDASAPGNFGFLESNAGNGASALAQSLGYNSPPGDCQPITGVTTKTGMNASVLNAINTRFDVFANGNQTCPSQGNGTCSPARNSRKDLVCKPNNSNTACTNDTWVEAPTPYYPTTAAALPANGSLDPSIMGYPKDLCHAVPRSSQTCSIVGSGIWDRDAYFRVNYGWTTQAQWTAGTGLPATTTRFAVYNWELANKVVTVGGINRGIDVPQTISGNEAAFGYPATGRTGVAATSTQADRRRIAVAVLNCQALNLNGKSTNIPVSSYLDVFLVEPAIDRTAKGGGKLQYTDQKDIYVEAIAKTVAGNSGATAGQVVRRDTPYLIQ